MENQQMFNTSRSVDPTGLAQLFNLPPAITEQANDQLVDMIKQTPQPYELSALDMLITPDDVRAILSLDKGE